ncbi:MAG: glycosyltransferase [Eubacteriales bacterium]
MSIFKSVSIIVPAINETNLLQSSIGIILNTCSKEDIAEIIIVLCDRTSYDCTKTAEEVKDEFSLYPVKIYYQKEPFIGAAYKEPFMFVAGSHVIIMSADMETDPYLVRDFIEAQKSYPDSEIIASRWMKGGSFSGYNKAKLICNFFFRIILSILYFSRLTDMTCGYKSLPVYLVQAIDWQEKKHPIFLEMALKPLRLGVEIHEIPFNWKPRTQGKSQNSFFQSFKYFKTVFRIRFIKKSKILKSGTLLNRQN